MRKKFLGIVCILYSLLVLYIVLSGYLKNYLSPSMQKYILVATPILFIMGIINIISKENDYKFKFSDLILLLPILILFLAKDGRLSTSIANNRTTSFKKSSVTEQKKEKEKIEEIDDKEYDFSNVDFDVKDDSYQFFSDQLTYSENPDILVGKTIRVRGFTLTKDSAIPKGYFGIGKYIISCCVADAGFGGFIAKINNNIKIKNDKWYEVEGVLKKGKDGFKNTILYIDIKNIKEISKKNEELYVYPCYSYGDGECEAYKEYSNLIKINQ